MVKLTINGKNVEVKEGTTILDAASQAGIRIPTLCFLKDINEIGACRVCVVEVKDCAKLVTACNNEVWGRYGSVYQQSQSPGEPGEITWN